MRHAHRARGAITGLTLVLLFGGSVRIAEAHDHGTLKLASRTFRAGDSLAVTGAKFEHNDGVTLVLIGANGRVALGDVPTDSAGGFRRSVLVPASAAAGQYRLVAEAVDGDEVASLDVVVLAAAASSPTAPSPGVTPMPSMPGMDHPEGHGEMEMAPTGAPLAIARARSPGVTTTAVLFIILCALAGAVLLRGARTHPAEDMQ